MYSVKGQQKFKMVHIEIWAAQILVIDQAFKFSSTQSSLLFLWF